MRRFVQRAVLKPECVETYKALHASAWPGVLKTIRECHLRNYVIAIDRNEVFAFFEYWGDDYEADMEKMARDPLTQEWWKHTKPCFLHHDAGRYYEDMQEIFYCD